MTTDSALHRTRPVDDQSRIIPIDLLRGVALLGILLMNVQSFAMPGDAYLNPTAYGDLTGINRVTWIVTHVVADQKFIGIFSMLFGAGILLMSDRAGAQAARRHYRRMAVLIALGLLHAHLLWSGDILYTYGMCGLLVFLAREFKPSTLIVTGLLVHGVSSAIFIYYGSIVPGMPPEGVEAIARDFWRSPAADVARELAAYRGSWVAQQALRHPDAVAMETFIFAIDSMWKAGGLMLVGMGLLKLDVLTGRRSARFYRAMLGVGLMLGLPLVLYGVWSNFRAGWDVRYSLFLGSQFNYWGSVPLAIAWIAATMLWCRSPRAVGLQQRLAAIGRTALSNYLLQTVLCSLIFFGTGLGLFGSVSRVQQLGIVVMVWIIQLVLAPLWMTRFRYGPVEWAWRSLTYGAMQPMRRNLAMSPARST